MARKPRIEYEGAFYHVITRGNRKEPIFLDDDDKNQFLNRVKEYKNRYDFILYAFVLMDNHLHLLIETKKIRLSKIMQGLLQAHTQWHNRKYKTVGHLFQGRYKAILCDKNTYLLGLVRYIHLNPSRTCLKKPMRYEWSSHRLYLSGENNDFVNIELVLSHFARSKRKAIGLYKEFLKLKEGVDEGSRGEFYKTRDQRVLGDDKFYEGVIKKAREVVGIKDRIIKDRTLVEVSAKVAELTGVSAERLRAKSRFNKEVKARSIFIHLSKLFTSSKCKDIAHFLNREPGALNYITKRLTDAEFNKILEKLKW